MRRAALASIVVVLAAVVAPGPHGSARSGPGNPPRRVELPEGARLRAEPDAGPRPLANPGPPPAPSVVRGREGLKGVP